MKDKVAAGVAFLDEKIPGWENKIDLDTLSFPSFEDCVLGQLCGGYCEGLTKFDLYGPPTYDYGFSADTPCPPDDFYDNLTRAWKEAIQQKREHSK